MNFLEECRNQGLEPERTEDGSWTLRWVTHPRTETMHNPRGAKSETLFIYGQGLQHFLKNISQPLSAWSVGLGLGYIEMLLAALAPEISALSSFENVEFLRTSFSSWAEDANSHEVYDDIAGDFPGCRATLAKLRRQNRWQLWGDLRQDFLKAKPANLILFDAFSAKSSPELWTEDFLVQMLTEGTQQACVFVSYAATGNLNRALRKSGFEQEDFPGWGGKRESTLALRR